MAYRTFAVAVALAAMTALHPPEAEAYSVLAHEATVDALWATGIRPLLARRFPRANPKELDAARAYAYGGSVIQDLGYYPFGSHFFSNLLHYVRSGDFVEALLRDAGTVDEYAFALGALGHYTADNTGHPEAVNKSVPIAFPKLRAKYGDTVTYVEAPASHVIVEFSFDVVQAAAGAYVPDAYHDFIGFQVATPLLARAFRETYGIEMHDVLRDESLAISTYRRSVSELLPELTRVAWRDKQDEIARLVPHVNESAFIYAYTRRQYEQDFGARYRRRGVIARTMGVLYRLVPKVGPLKPLKFKAPTPEAERFFMRSFVDARRRYRSALDALRRGTLDLANTDFDTGEKSVHGEYALADDTYAELLDRLSTDKFRTTPPALRTVVLRYYAAGDLTRISHKERRRLEKLDVRLAEMNAALGAR